MGPRLLLTAKACALAACFAMGVFAPSAAQGAEVGVVPDITWGQPRSVVDREVQLLEEAGVQWVRANVNWRYIEPREGQIDQGLLAEYDYAVSKARAAGIKVLMLIGGNDVPYWASGDPDKYSDSQGQHWDKRYPPGRMADYASLVSFTVEHFGPMGVSDYEIWNEPNLDAFWSPKPNASRYTDMLRAAYPAAKAADPTANVILGGLSKNDFVFLEQVYAAGGGDYFDGVAVHPYAFKEAPSTHWYGRDDWGPMQKGDPDRVSWNCFPGIKEVRASMVANGDSEKKIWATEFGWSVTSQTDGVSPAKQAEYLTEAFEYVEKFGWMKAMFWYTARDNPFYNGADYWEARTGLFTTDFQLRPSYFAMQEYASAPPSDPDVTLDVDPGGRGTKPRIQAKGSVFAPEPAPDEDATPPPDEPLPAETAPDETTLRAKIQIRRAGQWRTKARPPVRGERYTSRFRVWVPPRAKRARFRTVVPGVGASRTRMVRV
jgi:hypothetical protein